MTTPFWLIEVLTLVSTGIFAGGMVLVMLAIVPAWLGMTPEQWAFNQQQIGPYIDRYMPILDGVATLGAIFLVIQHWSVPAPAITALLGMLGLISVAVISQAINVPINRHVRSWSLNALPPECLRMRERWIVWHAIRTLAGIVAFIALLLSIVL